jgi:hypothetical protein
MKKICIFALAVTSLAFSLSMSAVKTITISTQKYYMSNKQPDFYTNITIETKAPEETVIDFQADGVYKDAEKLDLDKPETLKLLKLKVAIMHHIDHQIFERIHNNAKNIHYYLEYEYNNEQIVCKQANVPSLHSWLTTLGHFVCKTSPQSLDAYINTPDLFSKLQELAKLSENL